jgi:hypothetical protein
MKYLIAAHAQEVCSLLIIRKVVGDQATPIRVNHRWLNHLSRLLVYVGKEGGIRGWGGQTFYRGGM